MDNIIPNLYDRQEDITDNYSTDTAMVIGAGGIGSWVALDLALIGLGAIIIIDHDKVELTNLNRTLFKLSDVGRFKSEAVKDLINERRQDCIVITIHEYFKNEMLEKFPVDYI